MASYRVGLYLFLIFLASCGGDSDLSGSASAFQAACESSSNMGTELCQCIAKNAANDLSPKALEFLTAGLNKDEAATAALKNDLPVDELMAAGMYMVSAPQNCAEHLP